MTEQSGSRAAASAVAPESIGPAPEESPLGHAAELFVAHREEVVLDRVDLIGDPLELTKELAFASLKDAV